MKKIKKLVAALLLYPMLAILGIFIVFGKEAFEGNNFTQLINYIFGRNLDFMIIGSVILFVFGTERIQNFIFKQVRMDLNIDNSFFIYLFFFPVFFVLFSDYGLKFKLFSFLSPLSARPVLQIFSFSFVILFTLIFLFSFLASLIVRVNFLMHVILNNFVIAVSVSSFLSFFTILFFTIINYSSMPEDKVYLIYSFIIFLMAWDIGSIFKKEEVKIYHELE